MTEREYIEEHEGHTLKWYANGVLDDGISTRFSLYRCKKCGQEYQFIRGEFRKVFDGKKIENPCKPN